MKNLNVKIFEETLALWNNTMTSSLPQTYDELKAFIMNEYSSLMTQSEHMKVISSVIHGTRKSEISLQAKEGEETKNKCFICDHHGHKMKKCWYYDASKMKEQNRKEALEKIKAKAEAKKKKQEENDGNKETKTKTEPSGKDKGGIVHKGAIVQLPPKEKAGMRMDAKLYCEPCYAVGVHPGQVDFIYDSGTEKGIMRKKEIEILKILQRMM
jgi:hypothetical protein